MPAFPQPDEQNLYLAEHIDLLRQSLLYYAGRDLIEPTLQGSDAAKAIYFAPFVVLSHNTAADPIFNYGNKSALDLFEISWQELTALPSRQSAEPPNREERAQLLQAVSSQGFMENYAGVRISKQGKRFLISDVTIWNLRDDAGRYCGQAAVYSRWQYL